MIPYVRDEVLISVQPHRFGVHWRKAPILALCEHGIRGRAPCDAADEELAVAPDIVCRRLLGKKKGEIKKVDPGGGLFPDQTKVAPGDSTRGEGVGFFGFRVVAFRGVVVREAPRA